jgi:F0F1-type ATP synthase delta subunit
MRASYYARALFDALREHPQSEEKLLTQFVETMRANGHAHMIPRAVRILAKLIKRDVQRGTITITTATPLLDSAVTAMLKCDPWKSVLKATHTHVTRTVDPSIIGGTIVRTSARRIDGSFKRTLTDLYLEFTS